MIIKISTDALPYLGEGHRHTETRVIKNIDNIIDAIRECKKKLRNTYRYHYTDRTEVIIIIDDIEIYYSRDYRNNEKHRLEKELSTLREDRPHLFI